MPATTPITLTSLFTLGRLSAALACALWLAACGGGGGDGGGSSTAFREPPPALSQDNTPTGARVDRRADNFFPMASGDSWTSLRTALPTH